MVLKERAGNYCYFLHTLPSSSLSTFISETTKCIVIQHYITIYNIATVLSVCTGQLHHSLLYIPSKFMAITFSRNV